MISIFDPERVVKKKGVFLKLAKSTMLIPLRVKSG